MLPVGCRMREVVGVTGLGRQSRGETKQGENDGEGDSVNAVVSLQSVMSRRGGSRCSIGVGGALSGRKTTK